MTGSLQIKNGKYYAVLNLKIDGKRKQKWIDTGLNSKCPKKEREKKLRDIISQYESNPQQITSTVLFADYVKYWLKEAKIKVDKVTYQHYEAEVNTHIFPYFKQLDIKLIDVTRQVLQKYFIEKYENGRIDGTGGLSPTTLKHHRNVINQSLNLAIQNNLILQNPCRFVSLPKTERYNYEFFNLEEINEFLNAIKNERLYPLYVVTATYGLRKSEVLGIKWDSIDFTNNMLTIKHTRVEGREVVEKDKTKNQSSYRSFPLSEDMVDLFICLKNDERTNKKLFGNEYIKNDYVFKMENGEPYRPNYISKKHSKILNQYGFKHIRFHDLRHSCASLLNAQGFTLKDIQEWLGHSDIQTTANTYAHLDIKRKQDISNTMSNIIQKC
jgi:integrase